MRPLANHTTVFSCTLFIFHHLIFFFFFSFFRSVGLSSFNSMDSCIYGTAASNKLYLAQYGIEWVANLVVCLMLHSLLDWGVMVYRSYNDFLPMKMQSYFRRCDERSKDRRRCSPYFCSCYKCMANINLQIYQCMTFCYNVYSSWLGLLKNCPQNECSCLLSRFL